MAGRAGTFGYKLYVGNLPWTVANRQLKEYFSQFGNISRAVVVFDKNSGMSKGFGFVTFSTEKSLNSVQNRANHYLEGNTLNINAIELPQQIE